jgi:hypothetical protein
MVTIKRNSNANNNLRKAVANGSVNSLFTGRTFYHPLNTIGWEAVGRYAMVGNNGSFIGFALVTNYGRNANSRIIELIGAKKGYGKRLMNRIIANAEQNNIKTVHLMAANNGSGKLIEFYRRSKFNVTGKSQAGTTPMRRVLHRGGLKSMKNKNNKN